MAANSWKKTAILLTVLLISSLIANIHLFFRAKGYRDGANEWLDKYTNIVEEFSQRKVYAGENESLQSDSIVAKRIVFLGTQVTERWDLQSSFIGFETINRGITGQLVAGMTLRFQSDVVRLMPQYVVIEISSYNLRPQYSLAEIQDYVISMTELARYHGITPILSTMIPLREGFDDFGDYSVTDNLITYNNWLKNYCETNNISFVDFYSALLDENGFLKNELSCDAIDPNQNGYDIMSKLIVTLLPSQ